MHDTGCLGLVHWDDPEGWYGEGGGRGVQDWEHVYTRGGFMLMCEMQEMWVRLLGREDPLGYEMAIHSSILA